MNGGYGRIMVIENFVEKGNLYLWNKSKGRS